jgi:hypothetical protein
MDKERRKTTDKYYRMHLFVVLSLVALLLPLLLCPTALVGQTIPDLHRENPREIIERLCKMDEAGIRLTPRGWHEADTMFLHPQRFSRNVSLVVKDGDCGTISAEVSGNDATVGVEYLVLGQIAPSMRFSWTGHVTEPIKLRNSYTLVHTDTYWVMTGEHGIRQVRGATQWKIEKFQRRQVVSVETAIRYVREVRERASDPMVKKNADETLRILSRHLR